MKRTSDLDLPALRLAAMQPLWAILTSVAFSYLLSYWYDLQPFNYSRRQYSCALRKSWGAVSVSATTRVVLTSCIILGLYPGSWAWRFVGRVHVPDWSVMLGVPFVAALLVVSCPDIVSRAVKEDAKKKLRNTSWLRAVIRAERWGWADFRGRLEFARAEDSNAIDMDSASAPAILALFEEQKSLVVRHYHRHRDRLGEETWLYLGLLAGNHHSKRAEGLMVTKGLTWLTTEIQRLRSGRPTLVPAVDGRRGRTELIKNPPVDELLASRRKTDVLLGELLNGFSM